ncbi:MAG: VWA domain-containing protein [Bacteroidia bacterium]|nr:VWA domain-containing protein [Bacteroidia bacterium]
MGFSYSEHILWFVAIPFALMLILLIYRRTRRVIQLWFDPVDYAVAFPFLKNLLRIGGIIFAFIALLGPHWGKNDKGLSLMGKEIYILLDVSASMNADDVRPSRLDKAKKELKYLIDNLKGNQIGIIVFASDAYVQCPATRDNKALNLFLELSNTSQFAHTGTDLRSGLQMVNERLYGPEKKSDRVNKAVVLVTDGENFGDGFQSVLDKFKRNHINVFVVGVGTPQGAAVPDMSGGKLRGHKHRTDGSLVNSVMNESFLKELSAKMETPFISLDNPSANLKSLTEELQSLSSSPMAQKYETVANSKYYYFALLAFACWAITLFLLPHQKTKTQES